MRRLRAAESRGFGSARVLVAALFVATLAAPRVSRAASLDVRGRLECPTETALRSALAEELSALDEVRPKARVVARGSGRGALELQLRDGAATLRRRTVRDAQARCDQLADAAVLLVRIWRQELGAAPPVAASEKVARAEKVRRRAKEVPAPEPESDPADTSSTPPIPETTVEVELDPERTEILLAAGVLAPTVELPRVLRPPPFTPPAPVMTVAIGGEHGAGAEAVAVTSPPARAPRPVTVALLSGLGWYQGEGAPGLVAHLRGDVGVTRSFAAGLQLSFDGRRTSQQAPGAVHAQALSVSALGRWRLKPATEMGPSAALGAKLDRIDAWSEGYSRNGSAALYAPGMWGEVGWTQPLGARFSLVASVGLAWRFTRETFSVAQVGEVLTLPNLALSGSAGVGWTIP